MVASVSSGNLKIAVENLEENDLQNLNFPFFFCKNFIDYCAAIIPKDKYMIYWNLLTILIPNSVHIWYWRELIVLMYEILL